MNSPNQSLGPLKQIKAVLHSEVGPGILLVISTKHYETGIYYVSMSENKKYTVDFKSLNENNLNFELSATNQYGNKGTLSETIFNTFEDDMATEDYVDTLNVGTVSLEQSPLAASVNKLNYNLKDVQIGSIDYYSQKSNPTGGESTGNYIENEVNEHSKNIDVYANPYMSRITGSWKDDYNIPTKYIRVFDDQFSSINSTEHALLSGYHEAIVYHNNNTPWLPKLNTATNIYNSSKYQDRFKFSPYIGDLPAKLKKVFEKLDNDENHHFDIIIEAGLGTIYAQSSGGQVDYKDSNYFDISSLYTFEDQSANDIVTNYKAVADEFLNFAKKGKRSLVVLDPLRSIFVQSDRAKTIDNPNNQFGLNIYWPLKHLYKNIDNSKYKVIISKG